MHLLALHVSNSQLEVRAGGGGGPPTVCRCATFACLQCAEYHDHGVDDDAYKVLIRTERVCCNVGSKLISCNFPRPPPTRRHPQCPNTMKKVATLKNQHLLHASNKQGNEPLNPATALLVIVVTVLVTVSSDWGCHNLKIVICRYVIWYYIWYVNIYHKTNFEFFQKLISAGGRRLPLYETVFNFVILPHASMNLVFTFYVGTQSCGHMGMLMMNQVREGVEGRHTPGRVCKKVNARFRHFHFPQESVQREEQSWFGLDLQRSGWSGKCQWVGWWCWVGCEV